MLINTGKGRQTTKVNVNNNYIKTLNFTSDPQEQINNIKCLYGPGAPANILEGALGQLYYDTMTYDLYQCVGIIPQGTQPETYHYNWNKVSGGSQKIYKHSVLIFDATGKIDLKAYITFYTSSNTSFNASSLINYISQTEKNQTSFATGYFTDDNVNYHLIYNLHIIGGEMNFEYIGGIKTLFVPGVNDKVTEI